MGDVGLVGHQLGVGLDGLDQQSGGPLDAVLEQHGVGAGGDVLEAFGDDGLGQNGGGGGAITGDVVGLGGGFLQKLGAHVLIGIVQLNFLGHGHAVMSDGGSAEFLVQGNVAALGAKGRLDRLGQDVNALLKAASGIFLEHKLLCHDSILLRS